MRVPKILWTGAYLTALLLVSAIPSFARPFLVSDPYPKSQIQPTRFEFVCGKLKFSRPPEILRDGRKRLKLDLSALPDGEVTLEIKAVDDHLGHEAKPVSVRLLKRGEDVRLLPPLTGPPSRPAPDAPQAVPEKQKIPPSRSYPGHLRSG